jgi:hypothetical protein
MQCECIREAFAAIQISRNRSTVRNNVFEPELTYNQNLSGHLLKASLLRTNALKFLAFSLVSSASVGSAARKAPARFTKAHLNSAEICFFGVRLVAPAAQFRMRSDLICS